MIALCKYDNTVCLLRSTSPDVTYVIASFAILMAPFELLVGYIPPPFPVIVFGSYKKYSCISGAASDLGSLPFFATSNGDNLLEPFLSVLRINLILSGSINLTS